MPISQMFAGLSARAEGFTTAFLKTISDTFNRSSSSGVLGTANSGQTWSLVNGTWYTNSGVAATTSVAANYPYATIPYKADATITLKSTTTGTGILFWQTDSNDWWAAQTNSTTSTYYTTGIVGYCIPSDCCSGSPSTCSYYSPTYGNNCCAYQCQSSYVCGAGYTGPSYYAGYYSACCTTKNTCVASGYCGSYYSACCNGSNTCSASSKCGASGKYAGTYNACCTGSNHCSSSSHCGAYFSTCCTGSSSACVSSPSCGKTYAPGYYYMGTYSNCCNLQCLQNSCCSGSASTCQSSPCCSIGYTTGTVAQTQWNWQLSILQSIGGIVSKIANAVLATTTSQDVSSTQQINAIKVVTLGNNVTATGYSDQAGTTSLGTVSTTNTGSKGTGVGIINAPEGYFGDGYKTVGPFTAQ